MLVNSSRLRRSAVALAAVCAMFVGITGTASADVLAEGTGVRGRGDWTWSSDPWELSGIYLGVRDTACDNNPVYVRLKVYTATVNGSESTQQRYNYGGCGSAKNWYGLAYRASGPIKGVKVMACVDDWGDDTCFLSEYHDNPNWG